MRFSCVSRNNSQRSEKPANQNLMYSSRRQHSCCMYGVKFSQTETEIVIKYTSLPMVFFFFFYQGSFSHSVLFFSFQKSKSFFKYLWWCHDGRQEHNPDVRLSEGKPNAAACVHLLRACAQSLFHIFSMSSSLWPLGGRPAASWLEGHWLKLAPAVPPHSLYCPSHKWE